MPLPPGMIRAELGKGVVLVIPERVYLAGLWLGKQLKRREALAARMEGRARARSPNVGQRSA